MKAILILMTLGSGLLWAGSPERARTFMRQYDQAYLQWINDVRTASTNQAQSAAWLRRPDEEAAGRKVWDEIRESLEQAWTLEPAGWLLRETAGFATSPPPGRVRNRALPSPAARIREAVRRHHLRSPKLGPYCVSLTYVEDPKAMVLLELIEKVNPSEAVKGAAALGQAILHRRLGDGKQFMARRQEKLVAAIKAPDLTVGRTTTQTILKDELYRMNRLSVGIEAPDFTGVEVNLEKSSLSDYRGKAVVLFFWHGLMPAHDESLALFRKYQEAFEGKDIEIIGVSIDNPLTLRDHIGKGRVTWRNFSDPSQAITKLYRIERWPMVYVLDHEGRIHYKGEPGEFVKLYALDLANQATEAKAASLEDPGE